MKIRYVDYGVANNFGDYIEINKELKKYPKLYNTILEHERSHTKKPFSLQDLKLDLFNKTPTLTLLKFCFKNPSTWIQFLPIYYKKGKIIYDINLILIYLFFVSLQVLVFNFFF